MALFVPLRLAVLLMRLPLYGLDTTGLPDEALRRVAALESKAASSRRGRLLLAETARLKRRAAPGGLARYEGEVDALVFDAAKLPDAPDFEAELVFTRALSYGAQRLRLEMPESDEKAWADELAYALERAQADAALKARLKAAMAAAQSSVPETELARAGFYAAKLLDSVDSFCWAVERGRERGPDAVGLTPLSDFMDRYGPEYRGVTFQEGSPYVRAGDRRYPAALYKAALQLAAGGGLAPVREALGPLETETLPELRRALAKLK